MTLANPLNLEAEVERRADTITPLEHTAVAVYSVPGVEAEAVVLHRAKAAMEAHGVLIRQGMALAVRLEHQMEPLVMLAQVGGTDAVMAAAEVMALLVQVELEGQAVRQEAEAQAREIRVLQMADWAVLEPFGFFHGR